MINQGGLKIRRNPLWCRGLPYLPNYVRNLIITIPAIRLPSPGDKCATPRQVAGLTILAKMRIYIIDFLLESVRVEAVSLIESVCPYTALHHSFAKRADGTTFVSLHNDPDGPGYIFHHEVNMI